MLKFVITGTLAGLNEIIGANRSNRYAGASQKKAEQKRCAYAIMASTREVFERPVQISFRWIEKDLRRDPDNICAGAKFVLDALVELGRLQNDNRKWVKGIMHEFPDPEKLAPRVEVEITEFN